MTIFDQALTEIQVAPLSDVMEGGSAIMAMVGEAILKRMDYPPDGKASVKFDISDKTVITITWGEE
jgi:hypothetical protein